MEHAPDAHNVHTVSVFVQSKHSPALGPGTHTNDPLGLEDGDDTT